MNKIKNFLTNICTKSVHFGKAVGAGIFGIAIAVVLCLFVIALVLAMTVGVLVVIAGIAYGMAHILGLSTGWAIAFFLAMVWLLWRK